MKKLTPKQQDLFDAMKAGVIVHCLNGVYFRGDTYKRVSRIAAQLLAKDVVKLAPAAAGWEKKLVVKA